MILEMDIKEKESPGPGLLAGVSLTSLAALMLQVSLTRLFSVTLWHHFAFMVASIAFLGFGASGTFLMVAPGIRGALFRPALAGLSLGFSIITLGAYWCSNLIPFDPARIMWDRLQWVYLLGLYAVLALPFFLAGLILALVYANRAGAVGRLYACDLFGAGWGCAAIFLIYPYVGESGLVLVVCMVAALASFAFYFQGWKMNLARGVWLLALFAFLVTRPPFLEINISPYKALRVALSYPDARILETRWRPAARLDVIDSKAVRFAPGLSLEFKGGLPEQLGLCLDAGHLNAVTRFAGNPDNPAFAGSLPASVAYAIQGRPDNVLIIEPLGGLDVLSARYHGASNIKTAHANPAVLDVMTGPALKEFSGNLYETGAVAEQGRSFLLRTDQRFDVIQVPVTDSLGAASAGLYGLSEDYTLTVDAFKAYIGALKPLGLLAVTRYLLPPPRHEIRLVAIARSALEAMGVKNPGKHIAAIRSWGTFTLLVGKSALGSNEIARMKDFCRRLRFDLVYYPGMERSEANIYNRFPTPVYHDMVQKVLDPERAEIFYEDYTFDVRPVTDDRPFFYHNFRLDRAVELYHAVGDKWQLFIEGGCLVYLIFIQAVVISIVLIIVPAGKARGRAAAWFLVYFGLIGVAFMLTEICLVQRFILLLANPVYAFSVVLFSVLLASSLGSYSNSKFNQFPARPFVFFMTPVLLLAYIFFLDKVLMFAMPWPLWVRCGFAFLVILPLGFVMGTFFPAGVRALSLHLEGAIPWAWAVNAGASVVGSVMAVLIAMSWGFGAVLGLAAALYALAPVLLLRTTFFRTTT